MSALSSWILINPFLFDLHSAGREDIPADALAYAFKHRNMQRANRLVKRLELDWRKSCSIRETHRGNGFETNQFRLVFRNLSAGRSAYDATELPRDRPREGPILPDAQLTAVADGMNHVSLCVEVKYAVERDGPLLSKQYRAGMAQLIAYGAQLHEICGTSLLLLQVSQHFWRMRIIEVGSADAKSTSSMDDSYRVNVRTLVFLVEVANDSPVAIETDVRPSRLLDSDLSVASAPANSLPQVDPSDLPDYARSASLDGAAGRLFRLLEWSFAEAERHILEHDECSGGPHADTVPVFLTTHVSLHKNVPLHKRDAAEVLQFVQSFQSLSDRRSRSGAGSATGDTAPSASPLQTNSRRGSARMRYPAAAEQVQRVQAAVSNAQTGARDERVKRRSAEMASATAGRVAEGAEAGPSKPKRSKSSNKSSAKTRTGPHDNFPDRDEFDGPGGPSAAGGSGAGRSGSGAEGGGERQRDTPKLTRNKGVARLRKLNEAVGQGNSGFTHARHLWTAGRQTPRGRGSLPQSSRSAQATLAPHRTIHSNSKAMLALAKTPD